MASWNCSNVAKEYRTFSSIMMIQGNPAAYNLMRMPKQMMPTKTIAELVVETPCFGTLLAAVQAADLVETLSGEGPFTVLLLTMLPLQKFLQKHLMAFLRIKKPS